MKAEVTEIRDIWRFSSYSCNKPQNRQMSREKRICDTCALNSSRYEILKVFTHTVLTRRKTVKWAENTICDTCGLNSRTYDIFKVLAHTVVISRKMVKWAQNTICDTCGLNSRRYEIFEVFAHNVVLSRKTVKWAQNTICDKWKLKLRRYEIFEDLAHTVVISRKTVKWAGKKGFVILVHSTPHDMRFWKFLLKQFLQDVKRSNGQRTPFVILVDWTHGHMTFLKF